MQQKHWIAIALSSALFIVLYFGFDTKNTEAVQNETSRNVLGTTLGFDNLLTDASEHLSPEQSQQAAVLLEKAKSATDITTKSAAYQELSAFWYKNGNIAVAGGFADSVATIENNDEAWSVAGATYYNGLVAVPADNQILRKYCADKAIRAFESAVSLNPQLVNHQVNLALVYAEQPKEDNPMQAVMMLRELETKHPEEPSVFNALGRLAIKTGQWDRAVQRLEKAWTLDPKNPNTPCLLAKAYQGANNLVKAEEFAKLCK
jgi:tetratricopeptide (TPR) repeat protein